MKIKLFTAIFVLSGIISNISINAQAYNKKANIGFGLWELAHLGIDYRIDNYSIGGDIGCAFPFVNDGFKYLTFTIDNAIFFGGQGYYDMKSFYISPRLTYIRQEDNIEISHNLFISPTIGKEFNLDERIGIKIDVGLTHRLIYKRKYKIEIDPEFTTGVLLRPPFIGRIQFYYRF